MHDNQKNGKVTISIEGDAGPYIMVGVDQLLDLRKLLNDNDIGHSADAITQLSGPATAAVNLGKGVDVDHIQSILDSAD